MLGEPEEQVVLGEAQLAVAVRVAAAQPPDGRHRALERDAELASGAARAARCLERRRGSSRRRLTRARRRAPRASTTGRSSPGRVSAPRARRGRGRCRGTIASARQAERPPEGGAVGGRGAAPAPCAPISARWSTTARTAVPIEPPTRCSTFSCGVASASSERPQRRERGRHRRHEGEPDAHRRGRTSRPRARGSRCARR